MTLPRQENSAGDASGSNGPHTGLLTLRDLLRWSISRFNAAGLVFGHGSDNAWDEAVYLLLHALDLPPDTLEPFLDARLLEHERIRCIELIHERIHSRKPAAYLTGEAWLQGLRFIVDERAIVPRSPIAELLADSLAPWVGDADAVTRVLDLCTGTGCLAILAAYAFGQADIDAADLSTAALELAQANISLHGLDDRVQLINSDLYSALGPEHKYDLILCNPPYVNADSMAGLPPEYRHEPQMALAGGTDGMDLVRRILADAARHLNPDGILILEIGHELANFEAAFPDLDPVWLSTATASNQILMLRQTQLQA